MPTAKLIADSGATKAEWSLIHNGTRKTILTQGISPYFLNQEQISSLLLAELTPKLKNIGINEIHYYGTGCANPENAKLIKRAIKKVFPETTIEVNHDLLGAARACCGKNKAMVANLGTGSFCCYYDGKKIARAI